VADHRRRNGRTRRAGDPAPAGRPSKRASERLETQFATELGLTRAAWDDALLRSEERLRRGDAAGVVASLDDQRRMLELLEGRLRAVVSSAAVEREAERVVAAAPSRVGTEPVTTAPTRPSETLTAPDVGARPRSRVQALVGAGAAVAVTLVAIALGVTLGLGTPPAPEVASPVDDGSTAGPTPADDVYPVVAIAAHHAVSSVQLAVASTNWLQELGTVDPGASGGEAEEASDVSDPGSEAAARDEERTGDRASAAGAKEEAGAGDGRTGDGDAGRDPGDAQDDGEDETDETGVVDLGELDPDQVDEEASLGGDLEQPLDPVRDHGLR
jgi:hypothetical protein